MLFFLFLVPVLAWSAPPADLPLPTPSWLPKRLEAADKAMSSVEPGRWLRALAGGVKVEPRVIDAAGPAIQFLPGAAPAIGVDPARSLGLTALQFELALARARARAAFSMGFSLIEAEQAAEQTVAAYAFERAQAAGTFGEQLKRPLRKLRASPEGEPLPRLSWRDPEREAQLLSRFARDPEDFYWTVERDIVRSTGAVRLPELEAFLWGYAEALDAAACPPPGRYCKLAGRLARPELVAAARAVKGGGGLERLGERLGAFQQEKGRELQSRIRAWLKLL